MDEFMVSGHHKLIHSSTPIIQVDLSIPPADISAPWPDFPVCPCLSDREQALMRHHIIDNSLPSVLCLAQVTDTQSHYSRYSISLFGGIPYACYSEKSHILALLCSVYTLICQRLRRAYQHGQWFHYQCTRIFQNAQCGCRRELLWRCRQTAGREPCDCAQYPL